LPVLPIDHSSGRDFCLLFADCRGEEQQNAAFAANCASDLSAWLRSVLPEPYPTSSRAAVCCEPPFAAFQTRSASELSPKYVSKEFDRQPMLTKAALSADNEAKAAFFSIFSMPAPVSISVRSHLCVYHIRRLPICGAGIDAPEPTFRCPERMETERQQSH